MSCDKIQHKTHKEANQHVKGLAIKDNTSSKIYKCDKCGFFHVSTYRKTAKIRPVKPEKYKKKNFEYRPTEKKIDPSDIPRNYNAKPFNPKPNEGRVFEGGDFNQQSKP